MFSNSPGNQVAITVGGMFESLEESANFGSIFFFGVCINEKSSLKQVRYDNVIVFIVMSILNPPVQVTTFINPSNNYLPFAYQTNIMCEASLVPRLSVSG